MWRVSHVCPILKEIWMNRQDLEKSRISIFIIIRLFGIQLSMGMDVKNLVIAFYKCFAIVLTDSQDRADCQTVRYLKQSNTHLLQSFLWAGHKQILDLFPHILWNPKVHCRL